MIIYPYNWHTIGENLNIPLLERYLQRVIEDIPCQALSLSGGVDSALLLYFMSRRWGSVRAYTVGYSENHPDVIAARMVCEQFSNVKHIVHIPSPDSVEQLAGDLDGDEFVREFYRFVAGFESKIIAGDGVDEFMCGYYGHQTNPTDETYRKYIKGLVPNHLVPLDKNSGRVMVYLPYLDERLVSEMSMIPISDKVDSDTRKKIIISIAKGKLPDEVVYRRKYGFVDALNDIQENPE